MYHARRVRGPSRRGRSCRVGSSGGKYAQEGKALWRRLLAIDRVLRKGGHVTCGKILELPECEGYNRKTVLRDTLKAPVEYDPHLKSYYYTKTGFFLKAKVNDLFEVRRWVLSWGAGAEVLGPKELRDGVRKDAAAVARANG